MSFDITGIGAIFDFGSKVIDKIFPDKDQADKAKLEMFKMQQDGVFKDMEQQFEIAKLQIQTNIEDAKQEGLFPKWRSGLGWVCTGAFAYNYVIMPFIAYAVLIFKPDAPEMPILEMGELTTLLFGMLGLGAMRTIERTKGVGK
jgi:hypothetical protein